MTKLPGKPSRDELRQHDDDFTQFTKRNQIKVAPDQMKSIRNDQAPPREVVTQCHLA